MGAAVRLPLSKEYHSIMIAFEIREQELPARRRGNC
jgi:hypothetical protein